jgi:ribonuclease Z
MRTILLGTGSPPPNPTRRGPSTLVVVGDTERFLVDAGSGVGVQLVQAGVRPYDWPPVFITHHHSDHTIDLGHLLITRWIVGQNAPLEVYGPAGTRRQVDRLLDWLRWDIDIRREHMPERQPPEVRVTEIEEGTVLERDGLRVSAFLVEHDPVTPAGRPSRRRSAISRPTTRSRRTSAASPRARGRSGWC